ncbi:hypothetical protein H0I76_13000 [Limibaculum sp. M0105]|uniref:Uncharacterized protein n=1 Tax=Thermohalobaculum xanthum TaxID=2753746 RepID=A0A8J7SFG5_9RHOB|nr:hypothetical protein [Thermohalobaculum xanthum]MBK0400111.1 hypothetical protein [Thermohalobaculum xanthum]
MLFCRFLGLVFLGFGLVVLGADVAAAYSSDDGFRLSALGEWWFAIHPDSLQLLQPAVERHLSPALWDPGIQSLLEWPLALEALALGALFLLLGRPWRRL